MRSQQPGVCFRQAYTRCRNIIRLLSIPFPENQPTRTFRNKEHCRQENSRRHCLHPQHPTPRMLSHILQQVVGNKCNKDSQHHIKLKHSHQPSAMRRRRDLAYIHRRRNRRASYAKTTQEPERQKRIPIYRQRRAQ